jgi:hypothetical protein
MCIIEELSSKGMLVNIPPYWKKYDSDIKKIFQKKVLKQLLRTWQETINWLMIYRRFQIDTNPMMEILTKIFMFIYRNNKQVLADKRAERRQKQSLRKKLYTLRNKKMLYKTI